MIAVVVENTRTHKQTILAKYETEELPAAKELLLGFMNNNKGYKGAIFTVVDGKSKRIAKARRSLFGKVTIK